MVYVQWLRVRNALKVTAIVFGALFLLAVIVHLSLDRLGTYNQMIDQISMQPGTSIQHTILPDGTPRSIIYNAKDRTRIVIDDHGYQGKQIIITEPASRQRTTHGHTIIGSINIVSSSNGRITTTVIDTDAPIESAYFIAAAMFVALMLATILGAPFARENDGHLEIALTKPIDRVFLAMQMMAVDAAGIVAGALMTLVASIAIVAVFQIPRFIISSQSWQWGFVGLVLALSWYALLAAATASLKRGYGAVLGFAWPVAIAVAALAAFPFGGSLIGVVIHETFHLLAFLDPLAYAQISSDSASSGSQAAASAGPGLERYSSIPLLIAYVALAVLQWRRVEA